MQERAHHPVQAGGHAAQGHDDGQPDHGGAGSNGDARRLAGQVALGQVAGALAGIQPGSQSPKHKGDRAQQQRGNQDQTDQE